MCYFESSVRVPLLVYHPRDFYPHRVSQNVSTLDILPTMCDFIGTKPLRSLPMDGISLLPHLQGKSGHDTAIAEYTGEGTIRPLMMIKRGPWKYITCPADATQLFNLESDPLELENLALIPPRDEKVKKILEEFEAEGNSRWDFNQITKDVLHSQRKRQLVWAALKRGKFTSWDYNPEDDGKMKYVQSRLYPLDIPLNSRLTTDRYIRSNIPLDDLERMARFPAVDMFGRETQPVVTDEAGSHGE